MEEIENQKIYHFPDWDKSPPGSSLTNYALCGQNTAGPQTQHWFAAKGTEVNCVKCKESKDDPIDLLW